jgi:hypothetical protein
MILIPGLFTPSRSGARRLPPDPINGRGYVIVLNFDRLIKSY